MQYLQVNQLKTNDITFFKLSENSNTVWVVDHYNKGYKTYSISKYEDVGSWKEVKATRKVFVDFTY